jgi:hypothetical protein
MNIFQRAKLETNVKPLCLHCNQPYTPDSRNTKRGWGLFCSKSCSVTWRNTKNFVPKSEQIQMERDKKLKQLGI